MARFIKGVRNTRDIIITDLMASIENTEGANNLLHHRDVYFHGDNTIDSLDRTQGPFVLIVDVDDTGSGYRRFNLHHSEPLFVSKSETQIFNIMRRFLGTNGEIGQPGRTALVKVLWKIMQEARTRSNLFDSALRKYRLSKD